MPSKYGVVIAADNTHQRSVSPPPLDHFVKVGSVDKDGLGLEVAKPTGGTTLFQVSSEVIQQVLAFLNGLDGNRITPTLLTFQVLGAHPTTTLALRVDESLGTAIFSHPILGFVMTRSEHELLNKFLKMKPPSFHGAETKDAFEFTSDYYDSLHKLGIVHQHGLSS